VQTNAALRQRYEDAARARDAAIAHAIRRAGAEHLVLATDRDWLLDIVRFVAARRARRGGNGPRRDPRRDARRPDLDLVAAAPERSNP